MLYNANDVKSDVTSYAKDRWRHTRLPDRLALAYVNIVQNRVTGSILWPIPNPFTCLLQPLHSLKAQ